jgi:predicted nucleic acid-binding protein
LKTYYDTGIFIKLYTAEVESESIEAFVLSRKAIPSITDLHIAECTSALRLKVFRKECDESQASAALNLIQDDIRRGVIQILHLDWNHAWLECRLISDRFSSLTGARTLDALHVAVAHLLGAKEFVTSDKKQAALAKCIGISVVNPAADR